MGLNYVIKSEYLRKCPQYYPQHPGLDTGLLFVFGEHCLDALSWAPYLIKAFIGIYRDLNALYAFTLILSSFD